MAYVGKFVDRNPGMKTAGIASNSLQEAGDALQFYSMEEGAENVMRTKCKQKRTEKYRYGPRTPVLPKSDLKDILSPELQKSRFVAFREKFSEDLYFKKPELGKVFPLHSKPDQITNENTTFGDPTHRSEAVYELVLPKKSVDEVNREYMKWHDKYVLSHGHYLPSEQINRHYDRKVFNPRTTFGKINNVDMTGGNVKKILTQCDHLVLISKAQKNYLERVVGRLGKKIPRHNYSIPTDMTFGLPSVRDKCDAQALLENIDTCAQSSELIDALSHINKWRHILFKRLDFQAHDLKIALEEQDTENTGYLPISKLYAAARSLLIRVDEDKIRTALRHFNMIEDECLKTERVRYEHFWRLLTIQYPMPMTGSLSKLPSVIYNKETTYRELCKDMEKKPVEAPPLSKRHRVYKNTAKDAIEPDIPMQFGLEQSDFEEPRPKEDLRKIFKRVLTDKFDEVWERAKDQLKPENELISVDQLRSVMNNNQSIGR